jgi:hypothetical protein
MERRQRELLEIVLALRATRRFAGCLRRRKNQCEQRRQGSQDDQQFDERKAWHALS